MIIHYKLALLLSLTLFLLNVWAQNIVEELDNGNITVHYSISESYDEFDNEFILIEDTTITVANLDLQKCISLMKDVKKHKLFTGDAKSEIVRTISDNEWIVYYFNDNPWPIANSDCVARMIFTENKYENTATFTLIATPSEYKKGEENRMTRFNLEYTFKELENGKIKITMIGKTSPPVNVPMWLIKTAFPGAPADAVRKLVELAKKQSLLK